MTFKQKLDRLLLLWMKKGPFSCFQRVLLSRNWHSFKTPLGRPCKMAKSRQFWWGWKRNFDEKISNFSGLWSLELIHLLKTLFTVRLKARTQWPEKFDISSSKSVYRPSKLSIFGHFTGSPQRRRLRRRLRMSIACLPCIPPFNHYHFVKLTSVLTYMFIHFYLNENGHRRRRWGTPCI